MMIKKKSLRLQHIKSIGQDIIDNADNIKAIVVGMLKIDDNAGEETCTIIFCGGMVQKLGLAEAVKAKCARQMDELE